MKLAFAKKLQGLFYPVLLRTAATAYNPILRLYFFRGRYQLATGDALYSDGSHYRPLVAAFTALKPAFPAFKNALILGTGLGSAVQVAHSMGFHPAFTLVDLDNTVLEWTSELMPDYLQARVTTICANAETFITQSAGQYDLIVVDIFIGRAVPPFVTESAFLLACKARLTANGRLVLNYMVPSLLSVGEAKSAVSAAFGRVEEISFGLNRVYIA